MSNPTLSNFEILLIYKQNVLKFLDQMIELFPEESDMIVMRILFENQVPIEESMIKFSKRLLTPVEIQNGKVKDKILPAEMIRKRNDKFFMDNKMVFSGVDDSKLIRWSHLWQSKRLDKSDREAIWRWVDLFLGLAEMYTENIKRQI